MKFINAFNYVILKSVISVFYRFWVHVTIRLHF
jgi:hypothetical protein